MLNRPIPDTRPEACFRLLQNVLMEAFQTEVSLFTPPYEDLTKIDHNIRNIMWPDYLNHTNIPFTMTPNPAQRFLVIKSNLGFYNLIAYLTFSEYPDFISIGPFRTEKVTSEQFSQIIRKANVPPSGSSTLKHFFETLPQVSLPAIISITKAIISSYYSDFQGTPPIQVEFSQETHLIDINTDMLSKYSAEQSENYQAALLSFLTTLKKGELNQAQTALKAFLREMNLAPEKGIFEIRRKIAALNNYCCMALFETSVHPSHVLNQSAYLTDRISHTNSIEALLRMPSDICHKYCLLIKNYSFSDYSKLTRNVLNYIYLHLNENLTLSSLAEQFHKNAASLSGSFSQEVGTSITTFIHQTRIKEAIRYFNTTSMSVSDVAVAVGFQDFAYFSRLFRKHVGCSPREYCKSIQQ
ncbi:MAG: helix-turn-helix domain-containing protein [Lachnospiraceae bacterium]|nr:helix-turn-helix domain-containing protein [Lachnospiraceae bacterium]